MLSSVETLKHATDNYIDDIIVDEDVVSVKSVIEKLAEYGLTTKEPTRIEELVVLWLKIFVHDGVFY